MSEFSTQFIPGYYLVISDHSSHPAAILYLPKAGLYIISRVQMDAVTIKRKINSPDYNWLILVISFTVLRETMGCWKVIDRNINKNMVKQLYG